MNPKLLIFLSVLLDAVSTSLGLALGLAENGPIASRLLPVLGALYWLLELLVVYTLYSVLARLGLPGDQAVLASIAGPWLAGWSNLGIVLRHAGVLQV